MRSRDIVATYLRLSASTWAGGFDVLLRHEMSVVPKQEAACSGGLVFSENASAPPPPKKKIAPKFRPTLTPKNLPFKERI